MLVALRAHGYRGPMIMLAQSQQGAVDSFRLGATDFVTRPLRETEVLAAVERGLDQVRLRRHRDTLITRYQTANQQLEQRVKELTILHNIGQTVTALDNMESLFRRALEGATALTGAEQAFLLLRDEKSAQFILRSGYNVPLTLLDRMGEKIQDSLAEMVLSSQETLMMNGDDLRRYGSFKDMCAVIYVPLIIQKTVIGVLAVANQHQAAPFTAHHANLMRALASYLAMVIISTRLSTLLEQRSNAMKEAYRDLRERETQRGRYLQTVLAGLHQPLVSIETELARLEQAADGRNDKQMRQRLGLIEQRVRQLITQIAALGQPQAAVSNSPTTAQPGTDSTR
jgi:GAF domain-containing protein